MKYRALQLPAIILLLFTSAGQASAQFKFIENLFQPKISRVVKGLRSYIKTDLPSPSYNREKELHHIDMIFEKAMQLSKNDISTALLGASIAVLNRTVIKPTFPLLGIVTIPLPTEDSTDAVRRFDKLPRYFFPDSPHDKWGDSDKLVHFFGSAYLTYETGARPIPDAIGKFVESGEVALKLDTAADPRDVFANRLGQEFGRALSDGKKVIPSDYLSARYVKK